MSVLNIVLIFVILVLVFTVFVTRVRLNSSGPVEFNYDVKTDYMSAVNSFIKREFLFELVKWISTSSKSVDTNRSSNNSTSFFIEIQNPDVLQKQLSIMSIVICSKMSKELKSVFYKQYAKNVGLIEDSVLLSKDKNNTGNEDGLVMYISRHLMFFIRMINVKLSELISIEEVDTNIISNELVINIEKELYNINEINISTLK